MVILDAMERSQMKQDQTMEHRAARLDALVGGQREILAALTDVKGSLKRMVREHAEMHESLERRSMRRDDKGMMSRQSSASRHARHRAEDRGGTHTEYDGRARWRRNEGLTI